MHHGHTHTSDSAHPGNHHLLVVENLCVGFRMYEEGSFFGAKQIERYIIENLCISVHVGEIVAIVGASGSGKTLLADSILGLFEPNAYVTGQIWFDGKNVHTKDLAKLRGHGISLVPQSVQYLDPLMKVGRQVEGFGSHMSRALAAQKREELFERYELNSEVANMYPFELSGGMARRVLLCCALMDAPKLIVADEPTPGLDLPLAVKALEDLRSFANDDGGVLLITHDIELALRVADRIAVFNYGTIVEETAVENFQSSNRLKSEFAKSLWHALPEHDWRA